MNRPFSDVENHHFRNLLFIAEPNYIVPGRKRHTANFDKEALNIVEELKKEIVRDVNEAGHKTICITSDHGTSDDQFRTKKNALTVSRCTKNYVIKKDIVKMIKCEGSQTGLRIRKDVKLSLTERAGWESSWTVNWVTDNEAKQVNARAPDKHHEVEFEINYTGSCVDHTVELAIEESLTQCSSMKSAVHKIRVLVNHIKDSSIDREKFHKILSDSGIEMMTIIQGTANRWFFKYAETKRALVLKEYIDVFLDNYEGEALEVIDENDWTLILTYENALRTLVEAAKVLEGELYPTASSVIPFLDTVFYELGQLSSKLTRVAKSFVDTLYSNLRSNRRFPLGYKMTQPYATLTLLDPRYKHLYFSQEELGQAIKELSLSRLLDNEASVSSDTVQETGSSDGNSVDELSTEDQRRRLLLVAKNVTSAAPARNVGVSMIERVQAEVSKYLDFGGCIEMSENPCNWWRQYGAQFQLMNKFFYSQLRVPSDLHFL